MQAAKNVFSTAKAVAGHVVHDKTKIPRDDKYDYTSLVPKVTWSDITRYRYQHGCNIGSIFVLERWLKPSAFPDDAPKDQTSELAAVSLSVQRIGIEGTRKVFEKRWETVLESKLIKWLVQKARCTSIRLPIGYFTLGPQFCVGTPFEPYREVYVNAWSIVKKIVSKYYKHGLGTLIDFHALPGGANSQDHSGTNFGRQALWTTPRYMNLATRCLEFIAAETLTMSSRHGVVGLQIANEVAPDVPNMIDWYDKTIVAISRINCELPVYISDAWNLKTAIDYVQHLDLNKRRELCPVVIDTHYYVCFSDADKALSPEQLIAKVPDHLSALDDKKGNVIDRGAVEVVVGEYSCVFSQESWTKAGCTESSPEGKAIIAKFARAQNEAWQRRAGGCYFWTLLMDWSPGGAWGFTEQVEAYNIPLPPNFRGDLLVVDNAINRAEYHGRDCEDKGVREHTLYWNEVAPDRTFEHWRYKMGWQIGWHDAGTFALLKLSHYLPGGADHIGMVDLWVRKRLIDAKMQDSPFEWEFEHGLRAGILAFQTRSGIDYFPYEMGKPVSTLGHLDHWARKKGWRSGSKSSEQENAGTDIPLAPGGETSLQEPMTMGSRTTEDRGSAISSGRPEADILQWLSTTSNY